MARFLAFAIAAIAVASLAGCASPQQLGAQDDSACQSYGAIPGTPAYSDCRLRLAEMRNQNSDAFRRSLAGGLANTGNDNPNTAGGAFSKGMAGALAH
jgi:hypothetical protein